MTPDPGEPTGFINTRRAARLTTGPGLPTRISATTRVRLGDEVKAARAELARVDTKTNTLLAVCGVLLAGGVTVLGGKSGLPAAAVVAGWAAAAMVAAVVALLVIAIRPNLSGTFGFMRWAAADGAHDVLHALAGEAAAGDDVLDAAAALHGLAVMLRAKYRAVRRATSLLLTGLGTAAITAALTFWLR